MAQITKKQNEQYNRLITLHHRMISAKLANKRAEYESIIAQIREVVKEEEKDVKG